MHGVLRMKPLSSLPNKHFIRGWFQVVRAHYDSWRNGVQHRGISSDSLMCRVGDGDLFCAVLNDWDVSIGVEDTNLAHTGVKMTGTVPFMAIDLLTEKGLDGRVAILYRHDLEAFIWVLIWAVCCYDNGKMVYTVPQGIHKWDVRDPVSCGKEKRTFLEREELIQPASDDWGNGVKLARHLLNFMATQVHDRKAAVLARRRALLQDSGPESSHQNMPHEQEGDDPERVWYEFWAYLERFKEVVPCIADFMPKDLRKAGDADDKQ
ncbi:hypothetical protein GY45DRAFT_1331777 [Cubamyces sp. BRFM 1775]|nr:hypothetical protein GY45DRAFT_1331777 [Cubamyces sp. BRFM 1775]